MFSTCPGGRCITSLMVWFGGNNFFCPSRDSSFSVAVTLELHQRSALTFTGRTLLGLQLFQLSSDYAFVKTRLKMLKNDFSKLYSI